MVLERTIKYSPLPSQQRFHALTERYKGYSGPVGSGKSLALVHEALKLAVVNHGLLGLIGAPTYPMLRDVTQRAFFEVLVANNIPYEFFKQENLLRLKDLGSEIIFRSCDIPERLVGTNLAWFGIDEQTYCKHDSFLRLQARLRHPDAKQLCGFGVWTPNGFDWVYERYINPSTRLPGYSAVLATPRENKYLPSDFYGTLETSYDERFAKQEVEGEYLNIFAGQAYYAFSREHNVREIEYEPQYGICWALDFNIDPMCSVIAQVIDRTTRLDMMNGRRRIEINVLDELYLRNANTPQACEAFWDRVSRLYRGVPLNVAVYGDASGSKRATASAGSASDWNIVREELTRRPEISAAYKYKRSNPHVRDRVAAMNAALCSSQHERKLFIDPRCKMLIRDLERVGWKERQPVLDQDTEGGVLTHISDALGYLVESEMPVAHTNSGYRREFIA